MKFAAEERLRKALKVSYGKMIRTLLQEFMSCVRQTGIVLPPLTTDSDNNDTLKELMDFFNQMAQEESIAREAAEKANLKAKLSSAVSNFESKTEEMTQGAEDIEKILENVLLDSQKHFAKNLWGNLESPLQYTILGFSIDKQKVYDDNMEALRRLYLDNSIKRISGEKDLLKQRLLKKINNYVTGVDDTLDLEEITESLLDSSSRMARFFVRDQLSRLNKATAIATYENAGVTKVKWATARDVRVRSTHAELDGKVFDINELPKEIDDYNCRCALIPVEYKE